MTNYRRDDGVKSATVPSSTKLSSLSSDFPFFAQVRNDFRENMK